MARPEFNPDNPSSGGMLLPRDEALPPVPLEHTAYTIDVVGPLVDTLVVQRFQNAHSAPLDALYVFPLPADAAVRELELRIGERRISGELRERGEAERQFKAAAERGQGAALLGRERPNLFSVEVANLQPGERVEVRLRFAARAPYDDGWFTLSLPTVVLPRYLPEGQPAGPRDGVVPLLPEGERGHGLAVTITVDAGRQAEIESPSHELDITEERGRRIVTLRDPGAVPDRDLVLRYRPAGDSYASAAFAYRQGGKPGALLLMLTPRAVPEPSEVLPRELLFVFDRSGSMSGESIAQARNALRACLRALNPGDSFNIFPFDNRVERLAPAPLPFTQESVDTADSFIAGIDARGGTEIVGALREALAQPRDESRLRIVVFLTDGAVGNENDVLRELAGGLNEARVFAFGVGSAVNRFLLDKLAEVGRGSTEYILPGEPIEPAVQRFQRRASLPLLRDIAVDWGGASVADAMPAPIPDLYAGQPLVLVARFNGPRDERATLTLRARTATGSFEERLPVDLPLATPDRAGAWAALPKLWAQARLAQLEDTARLDRARATALDAEARELALTHALLSPHTSFVAVEESPPAEGRRAEQRVVVPVHLPAGTRRAAFEQSPQGLPAGALYAMAPPAPIAAGLPPKTPRGMAAKFLKSLRGDLESGAAGPFPAPVMRAGGLQAAARDSALGAAPQQQHERTAAVRRDAALRFLARTQSVDGSWSGDETVTALAALAFARAGHTERAGDFRPQLARTARWLDGRSRPDGSLLSLARAALGGNAVDLAAAQPAIDSALAAAGLSRGELAAAQRQGGDADGAVLTAGADAIRPSASTLALTAALALLQE
jgi:Ca-activated chloride channel family protein